MGRGEQVGRGGVRGSVMGVRWCLGAQLGTDEVCPGVPALQTHSQTAAKLRSRLGCSLLRNRLFPATSVNKRGTVISGSGSA